VKAGARPLKALRWSVMGGHSPAEKSSSTPLNPHIVHWRPVAIPLPAGMLLTRDLITVRSARAWISQIPTRALFARSRQSWPIWTGFQGVFPGVILGLKP
jgi:hypothetical protein